MDPHPKVLRAIKQLQKGKMVILVDDEERENEGDLCFAAEFTTPEMINFMTKEGRGLICLSLTESWIKKLQLPMMTSENHSSFRTNFTVSIEAREGITTGISAADRSHTIQTAIKQAVQPEDLVTPGHIFPLKAQKGGVLTRTGQTEGSIDLMKLANLHPSGVICEIMNDDGTMARMTQLKKFSEKFDLPIVSIADLISYRLQNESLITQQSVETVDTDYGSFQLYRFKDKLDHLEHYALVKGKIDQDQPVAVRVYQGELLGELLGVNQKKGHNLKQVLSFIQKEKSGIFVYMNHKENQSPELKEDRSILQKEKMKRNIGLGAQILRTLGVGKMDLISNSKSKVAALEGFGLEICRYITL